MDATENQELQQNINHHWEEYCKLRQELNDLYDQGEPFTSEKMIRVGVELDRCGRRLIELDRQYEDILLAELPK